MIDPGFYDISCPQGATFSKRLSFLVSNVPLDLTGYSARLQVRESYSASSAVLSLTAGTGITLGGTAGTIDLLVASTATAALTPGQYVYDLELVNDTTVDRWLQGSFLVSAEVTR
jgi:hypothetical protein